MSRFDVTIAGEINMDLILYGLPQEMAVERELLAQRFAMTLGSSSAILAHNLAALGLKVGFITKVGKDPLGATAMEWLRDAQVDLSRVMIAGGEAQTGVTLLLPHGSTRHILTYPGLMAEMTAAELDVDYLASSRHFHVSSIFLQTGLRAELPALCRTLKGRGLTISLDTNDDPDDLWGEPLEELLGIVDVFLPNEDEAKRITGAIDAEAAISLLALRVPVVAVKCGARGSLVQAGGHRWKADPRIVTPMDTIGAGDSYNAGFLKGYLAGLPLQRCAEMGNATAALSVLRQGGTEAFRDAALMREFLGEMA
ncbi:Sugar or nucleoside kinase, ribokinase family [Granulicella rosea]|uniref:Sugar or nucleoside kinase, ribokinase family n=1 Tax=Granulicella rosea TaxID=474952 RepID=A0A239MIF1_9BACT|nr:carbohydrate kinase family protein [Granulicella rosea]SNT41874.1 Sugar or nucleoside kinase, ribokinase family [Granulicella rosea]